MKLRRTVTARDVQAIRSMVAAADVFSQEEIDVAEELAQDAATLGDRSHYHFILADEKSAVCGYSCFGRIPLTDERYDLYWLVTPPAHQRKGIAALLLEHTERAVKALGGKAIYAETSSREHYIPAQRFYEKNGFTLSARVLDFYKSGDDKLLYSKWL